MVAPGNVSVVRTTGAAVIAAYFPTEPNIFGDATKAFIGHDVLVIRTDQHLIGAAAMSARMSRPWGAPAPSAPLALLTVWDLDIGHPVVTTAVTNSADLPMVDLATLTANAPPGADWLASTVTTVAIPAAAVTGGEAPATTRTKRPTAGPYDPGPAQPPSVPTDGR